MQQPARCAHFDARFAATSDGPPTLTGYAVKWNRLSTDRGYYRVRFKPNSAIFATPTHAYFHHDARLILGSTANRTLRLSQDGIGIKCEIDLPNTTTGRDVAEMVKAGLVGGMSFSQLYDDNLIETRLTENDQDIIEVSRFTCDEVTITPIPSFRETTIAVKDAAAQAYAASLASAQVRLMRLELDMLQLPPAR